MQVDWTVVLTIGVLLFFTFSVEGMMGFGSAILAMPFLMAIMETGAAIAIMVTLSTVLAGIIVLRNHRHVAWKIFFRIFLVAGIGIPFGALLFFALSETAVKITIGIFTIVVGANGVMQSLRKTSAAEQGSRAASLFLTLALFFGGVVHGAFGVGGPLIVLYASRVLPAKETFRATMSMSWICLNSMVIIKSAIAGVFAVQATALLILWGAPFMLLGLFVGNMLHHRISQQKFRTAVNLLMIVVGSVTLIANI